MLNLEKLSQITSQVENEQEDLLFIKNAKTEEFIKKSNIEPSLVEEFKDNFGDTWFSVKGGYEKEWKDGRTPYKKVSFISVNTVSLPKELSEYEYKTLSKQLFKIFLSDSFAYTSTSSYAAFWYCETSDSDSRYTQTYEGKNLRAVTIVDGKIIVVYEDENENDFLFKLVCE